MTHLTIVCGMQYYLVPRLLLLWCAVGVWRWGQGLRGAGASIGHDGQFTSGEKDVKRDEVEVLGNGGLVGRPSDAVVAGPALLLYLDNADASAVAAKAAVLPSPTVAWRGVGASCGVSTAPLLLVSSHLFTETQVNLTVHVLCSKESGERESRNWPHWVLSFSSIYTHHRRKNMTLLKSVSVIFWFTQVCCSTVYCVVLCVVFWFTLTCHVFHIHLVYFLSLCCSSSTFSICIYCRAQLIWWLHIQ